MFKLWMKSLPFFGWPGSTFVLVPETEKTKHQTNKSKQPPPLNVGNLANLHQVIKNQAKKIAITI